MVKNEKKSAKKITVFLCNWSGFTENDFIPLETAQCIPNIKVIRVMCSGSIKPAMILDALNNGSDGVLICACKLNTCHYISGNEKATERIGKVQQLLDLLNINLKKVRLVYISPNEREKFQTILTNFNKDLLTIEI